MLIASSFFIIFSGQFPMLDAGKTALHAQSYAEIVYDRLKMLSYEELDSKGVHAREPLNSGTENIAESDGWESSVTAGEEKAIGGDSSGKMRIATIDVFKTNETLPRFTLKVPLSDLSSGGDGTPIGTIIMRPTDRWTSESEKEKYLFCDGSKFSRTKYPKLYAILGTDTLPDLRERFPEGASTQQNTYSYKEAGLPNIWGRFAKDAEGDWMQGSGTYNGLGNAIYSAWGGRSQTGGPGGDLDAMYIFLASRSNPIYGNSDTVQPPSTTVNYYIKAK